jgi:hypothetical protein
MTNIYTEEDAKTKICPSQPGRCAVSECMAWRFVQTLDPDTLQPVSKAGYCGLGGKP